MLTFFAHILRRFFATATAPIGAVTDFVFTVVTAVVVAWFARGATRKDAVDDAMRDLNQKDQDRADHIRNAADAAARDLDDLTRGLRPEGKPDGSGYRD